MRTRTRWLSAGIVFLVLLVLAVFAVVRFGIKSGKVETVEYDSKALAGKGRMLVYLPPDYPRDAPYPVLYLLHGASDDESSWQKEGAADAVLDRLDADKKIVPMIVVMPGAQGRGSAFERDLLDEVIPYIEARYSPRSDSQGRAIAGVSLGGGQALSIGLKHADRFAWVGGFSPALAGTNDSDVFGNPSAWSGQVKLLWLSWGDSDRLKGTCELLHKTLTEKKIPHVCYTGPGGHEMRKNDLREFLPLLFREDVEQ